MTTSAGTSTGRRRALFANARYLVPRADWDHYDAESPPDGAFVRDVKPLAATGQLDLVEGEHEITRSLVTVATPGHLPGHTSVAIASHGERGFILGDVFLTTIDVEQPDWSSTFHSDVDVARQTRQTVLDRLEREGSLVGASHLVSPGLGRIVRGASGAPSGRASNSSEPPCNALAMREARGER